MLFNHIWHDWLRWIYFFGEWVKTTDQIESWGAHFVGWCPIIVGMNNWEKLVWITFSEKPTWGMPKQSPRLIKIIYIISMFFITKKKQIFSCFNLPSISRYFLSTSNVNSFQAAAGWGLTGRSRPSATARWSCGFDLHGSLGKLCEKMEVYKWEIHPNMRNIIGIS